LRAALEEANALAGADSINFAVGSGVQTVTPLSTLPSLSTPITIDATTQPGYAGSPLIEIDGSAISAGIIVLGGGANSTIRGLIVNGFSVAITVLDRDVMIERNWIGLDTDGVTARGSNASGIVAAGAVNLTIRNNIISGNGGAGIFAGSGSTSIVIEGNTIGLAADGTTIRPNAFAGIALENLGGSPRIGGSSSSQRNIICGNGFAGIKLDTGGVSNLVIQGNLIGVTANGSMAGNQGPGIEIAAGTTNVTIGGGNAGDGNVIAYNAGDGVTLAGATTTGNRIEGNRIHDNNGLGIDLSPNGVTPNDVGDADGGANRT
jgi:hypothetical protein